MQEYPKCLYQQGDICAVYVVVFDHDGEECQRQHGYAMANEAPKEKPARRGRPPKTLKGPHEH